MEGSSPNDGGDSKDRYEERIKKLERKIEELEKKKLSPSATSGGATSDGVTSAGSDEPQIDSIVEGVVGQFIPGLGGIIKALEKSSPEFRKRIADTDAEIKHRIDVGWSSKPVVDYHVSTRPMSVVVGPRPLPPRSLRRPGSRRSAARPSPFPLLPHRFPLQPPRPRDGPLLP